MGSELDVNSDVPLMVEPIGCHQCGVNYRQLGMCSVVVSVPQELFLMKSANGSIRP